MPSAKTFIEGLLSQVFEGFRFLKKKEYRKVDERLKVGILEIMKKYLQERSLSHRIEIAQIALNMSFVLLYGISTYITFNLFWMIVFSLINLFLSTITFFLYLLKGWKETTKVFLLWDIIVHPFLLFYFIVDTLLVAVNGDYSISSLLKGVNYVGILSIMRLLRGIPFLRSIFNFKTRSKTLGNQVVTFCITITSFFIIISSVLHIVNNEFGLVLHPVSLHYTMYVLLTLSQIGDVESFGDNAKTVETWSIKNYLMNITMVVFQYFALLYIVQTLGTIYFIVYRRGRNVVLKRFSKLKKNHVIINVASSSPHEVVDFLREFLDVRKNGFARFSRVYIIVENENDQEKMKNHVNHPFFNEITRVFVGDISEFSFLESLNVSGSKGVFLLLDKRSDDSQLERVLALRSFSNEVGIHCIISNTEQRFLFLQSGANSIVCRNDLRVKVMGKTLLCPGFCQLISNLLSSVTIKYNRKKNTNKVLKEYVHGVNQQIYTVSFSHMFTGKDFPSVNDFIYMNFHVCLLGLCREGQSYINPSSFNIKIDDIAIVIAPNLFEASKVSIYTPKVYKRNVVCPAVSACVSVGKGKEGETVLEIEIEKERKKVKKNVLKKLVPTVIVIDTPPKKKKIGNIGKMGKTVILETKSKDVVKVMKEVKKKEEISKEKNETIKKSKKKKNYLSLTSDMANKRINSSKTPRKKHFVSPQRNTKGKKEPKSSSKSSKRKKEKEISPGRKKLKKSKSNSTKREEVNYKKEEKKVNKREEVIEIKEKEKKRGDVKKSPDGKKVLPSPRTEVEIIPTLEKLRGEFSSMFKSMKKDFEIQKKQVNESSNRVKDKDNCMMKLEDIEILIKDILPLSNLKKFYLKMSQNKEEFDPDRLKKFYRSHFFENFQVIDVKKNKYGLKYLHEKKKNFVSLKEFKITLNQLQKMKNHLIVTGNVGRDIVAVSNITFCLRSSLIPKGKLKPIVFLADESSCKDLYNKLKFFQSVYFYSGSPTDLLDLKAVRINECYGMLYVLQEGNSRNDLESIKSSITTHALRKVMFGCVELADRRNVKFFRNFINPKLLKDRNYIESSFRINKNFELSCLLSNQMISGNVFMSNHFSMVLLAQSYYCKNVVDIVETLCGFNQELASTEAVCIIDLKKEFANIPFWIVYKFYLLMKGAIVLGIYRKKQYKVINKETIVQLKNEKEFEKDEVEERKKAKKLEKKIFDLVKDNKKRTLKRDMVVSNRFGYVASPSPANSRLFGGKGNRVDNYLGRVKRKARTPVQKKGRKNPTTKKSASIKSKFRSLGKKITKKKKKESEKVEKKKKYFVFTFPPSNTLLEKEDLLFVCGNYAKLISEEAPKFFKNRSISGAEIRKQFVKKSLSSEKYKRKT